MAYCDLPTCPGWDGGVPRKKYQLREPFSGNLYIELHTACAEKATILGIVLKPGEKIPKTA